MGEKEEREVDVDNGKAEVLEGLFTGEAGMAISHSQPLGWALGGTENDWVWETGPTIGRWDMPLIDEVIAPGRRKKVWAILKLSDFMLFYKTHPLHCESALDVALAKRAVVVESFEV